MTPLRAKAVNNLAFVAREQFLGGLQRRFNQMLRQSRAVGKTIKAVARVIGVQRNDSLKRARNEFGLEQADFRLAGVFPKLAVQILPAARKSRAVLETGRIANRIKRQIITSGQFRLRLEQFNELDNRVRAFRLVAVDAGENADADGVSPPFGPTNR